MKSAWEKPCLVVLRRGKPEEAVLFVCKAGYEGPIGPVFDFGNCNVIGPPRPGDPQDLCRGCYHLTQS